MGLLGGSTKTTTTSNPWEPQGNALKDIFSRAGDIFGQKSGTPWYEGELYAQMDPATRQAVQSMLAYTQGQGAQGADRLNSAGQQMTDPNAFNGAIGNFAAAAGADPTQSNINAARAYADNPAVNGMIDAASRDVSRNLYEQEIPGINRAGTATGNINSSRAGIAQGVAERGAADRIGDISASIRGDAYNRGLGLAEQARTTNLGAMGQTAGLYGQQFGMGADALARGNSMTLGNFGAAVDGSQLFQQDRQGQNDADFARWQGGDTRDMDLLDRYYSIVGSNNWGGTSTQKTKQSGSILGSLMGGLSLASGFGLFGGGGK